MATKRAEAKTSAKRARKATLIGELAGMWEVPSATIEVTAGRRFTKRWRSKRYTEFGESWIEAIDRDVAMRVEERKARAVALLDAAGYDASRLVREEPGGTLVLARARLGAGPDDRAKTEDDSALMLAARICYHCCQLDEWGAVPGGAERQIPHAYELGRLVVLAKAYALDDGQRQVAAKQPRPNRRSVDPDLVVAEFRRLLKQGREPGVARGILKQRGYGSTSTVYRLTKKIVR